MMSVLTCQNTVCDADEKAVATMLGLILNCTSSGLYMVS